MKSIMHEKGSDCYLCKRLLRDSSIKPYLEEHHAIFGSGKRKLSEKYGLKVYLCPDHHRNGHWAVHRNHAIARIVQRDAQRAFEARYPKLSFLQIFGMNYLDDTDEPPEKEEPEAGFIRLEESEWN
jgi:hypothetical protein